MVPERDTPQVTGDALLTVTGSRARAGVIAALFGEPPGGRRLRDLRRAVGLTHQAVQKELRRLESVGLVRVTLIEGRRQYEPETEDPVARALARFVHQTRGSVPAMRRALEGIQARSIAWLATAPNGADPIDPRELPCLIVLTSAPKGIVEKQVGPAAAPSRVHSMSMGEWVARLQKGEMFARRARRGAKLWVTGNGDALVRWEQAHSAARATLQSALEEWREELSDEWDDDWDPTDIGGKVP